MIYEIITLILSISTSGLIIYFTGLYTIWWCVLLLVLAIPFIFIVYISLLLGFIYIESLIIGTKRPVKKISKHSLFVIKQLAKMLLDVSNVKLVIKGKELLPKETAMFVSNHRSGYDPFPINLVVKENPIVCVTKPENLKIPFCGPYIHSAGYIVMDRENNFEAVKSIIQGANYIKKNQASVYIFPEGTRNKGEKDTLCPFHAGSFKMALRAKCPIVVMALRNTDDIKNRWPRRTRVYIDIIKVLQYEEYKDKTSTDLALECEELIKGVIKEIKK